MSFPSLTKNTCTTASDSSLAMAMISRSSILLLVIFCFWATFFTLVRSSRYSMAFSKSSSSEASCIFFSNTFSTLPYWPFRNSSAWLTDFQ